MTPPLPAFEALPDDQLDTIHGGVKLSVLGYPVATIGGEGSSVSLLGGQGVSNGVTGHLLQVTSGEAGQAGSHQFTLGAVSATSSNGLGALGVTAGSWTHTGENGSVGVTLGAAEVRGAEGYRPGLDVGGGAKLEGSLFGMSWSDAGGGNTGRLDVLRGEVGALAHQNEMFAGGGLKILAGEHVSSGVGAGYSVGLHMGLGVQVPELSGGAYRAEAQLGVIGVTGIITPERLQQGINQMMEQTPAPNAPAAPGPAAEAPAAAPAPGGETPAAAGSPGGETPAAASPGGEAPAAAPSPGGDDLGAAPGDAPAGGLGDQLGAPASTNAPGGDASPAPEAPALELPSGGLGDQLGTPGSTDAPGGDATPAQEPPALELPGGGLGDQLGTPGSTDAPGGNAAPAAGGDGGTGAAAAPGDDSGGGDYNNAGGGDYGSSGGDYGSSGGDYGSGGGDYGSSGGDYGSSGGDYGGGGDFAGGGDY